jgi:hypothetical protein
MRQLNDERKTTARRAQTAAMREMIACFYRTALDDYRASGYPFGNTVEGLLIWFEYGQRTTDS